ncbi:MAG: SIMPL domain-containing protein [Candidatus Bathyarchaeia archaeon]
MELRKYRVPLTMLLLSIAIFSMAIVFMPRDEKAPVNLGGLSFPYGIPSAFGTVSAIQVGEQQFNTISVTGSGTASMQADEATVTLGVQTQDESASEAVRLNAELMNAVIDAIKTLGITEEDMRTVSYSVSPVYAKYDYNQIVAYRVMNMIAVKITDMDLIGTVIDEAAEEGANRIQGVSFGLSDENQEELREQAYLAALDDAEGKAELIAGRLGLTITGVLYVSESTYQPYQPYRGYEVAIMGEATAPTPIIEGTLSVSVTVHIIYSFE